MPVWGRRYVDQFVEFCLPTLLAVGNLPSLAALVPCRFVLLSSEKDARAVSTHPLWRELQRHCDVEIRSIDDLITDGNHSATITLAFARAIRQAGGLMLDTGFVLLNSDYLFAAGSLKSVVTRIVEGASAVLAGNYQIVAEDAIPYLRDRPRADAASISLPARELVAWSFRHLHPATCANIVNSGKAHNNHTNRLFWRVGDDALIGRFYLLHPIAVRPELRDFVVGASFDYSFVAEMCPSGNVVAITDSDEYLVVEMQPRGHESGKLLAGPVEISGLAESLAEWTTADQRANVDRTFVYHAGEIPADMPRYVAEADAFVARVQERLTSKAHPYRHHHYWLGAIAAYRVQTRRRQDDRDLTYILGEALPRAGLAGLVLNARAAIFGAPPDVTPAHPRWPDYQFPFRALMRICSGGRLLLLTSAPANASRWLSGRKWDGIEIFEYERLLDPAFDPAARPSERFDAAVMVLTESQFGEADRVAARTALLLSPGGPIMMVVRNDRALGAAAEFSQSLAVPLLRLSRSPGWRVDARYVPVTGARSALYRTMERLQRRGGASGWRSLPQAALVALSALPLALASYACNLATRAVRTPPASGFCSSMFVILSPVKNNPEA